MANGNGGSRSKQVWPAMLDALAAGATGSLFPVGKQAAVIAAESQAAAVFDVAYSILRLFVQTVAGTPAGAGFTVELRVNGAATLGSVTISGGLPAGTSDVLTLVGASFPAGTRLSLRAINNDGANAQTHIRVTTAIQEN